MRIRRVTAHAFGPLIGETLELADGLTVVHGPNESAKSSWHAALTAALCGLRRGPRSKEDEDFDRRHKPWDRPDVWEVSAEVLLADGRRVELRHDLAGRVACYAKDLDRGIDYSNEITGSEKGEVPDASRWLGLERRTFRATASVAQAQLAAVAKQNDALREHVQRAVATAGADKTAAAALAGLDDYRRRHVGTDTTRVKPLQLVEVEQRVGSDQLATAIRDHAEYEQRAVSARRLREEADALSRRIRGRDAAQARAAATSLRVRATEAADLSRLLSTVDAARPESGAADVSAVSAALAAWRSLPASPDRALALAPAGVSADELRDLARLLERGPGGAPDAALAERIGAAESTVAALRRAGRRSLAVGVSGLVLLLSGAAAMAWSLVVVGTILAAVGTILAAVGVAASLAAMSRRHGPIRGGKALTSALVDLERARVDQATQDRLNATARVEWDSALARSAQLGLPGDPAVLRLAASGQAGQGRDDEWRREWEQARQRVAQQVLAATSGIGLVAATPDAAVPLLDAWLAGEPGRADGRAQVRDWQVRLTHLLHGGSLGDLERRRVEAARRAEQAGLGLTADEIAAAASGIDEAAVQLEYDQAADRLEYDGAAQRATAAEESLKAWAGTITPVAEAEERVAAATRELDRIRDLDRILGLTRDYLTRAQDRVYRAIAPRLAEAVGRDLATVTGGRYTAVIVDPGTLTVQVRAGGGRLRDAGGLSYGTTEQVYLLLRAALAEHLVRRGESCPLLLDDVTVHADRERTERVLKLLVLVAQRHQVVLFSQQDQVRDWAVAHLTDPRHALRQLAPVPTS